MKLIQHESISPSGVLLFGFIYLYLSERCGSVWQLSPDCKFAFLSGGELVHLYGVYFQLGYWGGNIMWCSHKCLESK
jgi:hypothetical protein